MVKLRGGPKRSDNESASWSLALRVPDHVCGMRVCSLSSENEEKTGVNMHYYGPQRNRSRIIRKENGGRNVPIIRTMPVSRLAIGSVCINSQAEKWDTKHGEDEH